MQTELIYIQDSTLLRTKLTNSEWTFHSLKRLNILEWDKRDAEFQQLHDQKWAWTSLVSARTKNMGSIRHFANVCVCPQRSPFNVPMIEKKTLLKHQTNTDFWKCLNVEERKAAVVVWAAKEPLDGRWTSHVHRSGDVIRAEVLISGIQSNEALTTNWAQYSKFHVVWRAPALQAQVGGVGWSSSPPN